MKVEFSRETQFVPTWKGNRDLPVGEQCSVTLKALEMGDLIKLMDSLQAGSLGKVDQKTLVALDKSDDISQIKEIVETCGYLIPKYCDVKNLQDNNGEVTAASLTTFPFYLELSAELLTELASISMPNQVEEKNSAPQPDMPASPTQ